MSDSKIIFHSRYLALAIMAALFWCLYSREMVAAEAVAAAVFLSVIAAVDLRFGLILDWVSAAFFMAVTIFKLLGNGYWTESAIGAVAAGSFFLLLRTLSGGGMGLGDVKLAAVIGWWLGPDRCLSALLLSFITAMPAALVLLVVYRRWRMAIPFGPFMALGAWLAFVYEGEIFSLWSCLWER